MNSPLDTKAVYHSAVYDDFNDIFNRKFSNSQISRTDTNVGQYEHERNRPLEIIPKPSASMSANYFSTDCTESTILPNDLKYFKGEYIAEKYKTEPETTRREDLVHIIQTIDGATKHKKIKIEEIFEILDSESNIKKKQKSERKQKRRSRECESFSMKASCPGLPPRKPITKKNSRHEPISKRNHALVSKSVTHSRLFEKSKITSELRNRNSQLLDRSGSRMWPSESSRQCVHNTGTHAYKQSFGGMRPYMLDAKSRREVKGFGTYCKQKFRASDEIPIEGKSHMAQFEVKYISPEFIRTSDLSIPETYHQSRENLVEFPNATSVMDKYQTEPKEKKLISSRDSGTNLMVLKERAEVRSSEGSVGTELDLCFHKIPRPKESMSKKPTKQIPILDRLKGDERDLPGIYSRFVRRSKKSSNEKLYKKVKNENDSDKNVYSSSHNIKTNSELRLEDYIFGELIADRPLNDSVLDLINKKRFKYGDDLFHKAQGNNASIEKKATQDVSSAPKKKRDLKTQAQGNKASIERKATQDVSLLAKKKTDPKTSRIKKEKVSITDIKHVVSKVSQQSTTPKVRSKARLKKKKSSLSRKTSVKVLDQCEVKNTVSEIPKNEEKKEEPIKGCVSILNHDPIRENLHISPTTTITMMVLAADKILAEKTELFQTINSKHQELKSDKILSHQNDATINLQY